MQKSKSGFTIVELLVVTIVIVILATITTTAYLGYQGKARAKQFEATTNQIAAFQRKYYRENGEYLSSNDMIGSASSTSLSDSDYTSIVSKTGISKDALTNNTLQFVPVKGTAGGTQSLNDTSKLYMMTRDGTNNSGYTFPIGDTSCSIYLSSKNSDAGTTEFAIAYYDEGQNKWVAYKSANGSVTFGSCSFAGTL